MATRFDPTTGGLQFVSQEKGNEIIIKSKEDFIFPLKSTSVYFIDGLTSDINALGITDTSIWCDFNSNVFTRDQGFAPNGLRVNNNSNAIPNIDLQSTTTYIKNCSGISNTYVGATMDWSIEAITPLTVNVPTKANGTTTYSNLQYFTGVNSNEFVYSSSIEKDFILSGQIVVDGGPNDEVKIIVRKFNFLTSSYEDLRSMTRSISNVLGALDIAYFNVSGSTTLNQNDRIEIWIENTSDSSDATILGGSFVSINERN